MKFWRKTISVIASLSLLTNALAAPLAVLAQEVTPTPEPTPVETTVPSEEPTIAPTEEATASPEVTPTEIATATPEATIEATPVIEEVTPALEAQPEVQSETTNENAQTEAPPSDSPEATQEPASSTPIITTIEPIEDGTLSAEIVETALFSDTLVENSWFQVITDKLDYAPTEAAVITGSGFTAGETYTLTVSSTDEPATSTTVEVTADSNGEFTYIYQLDGIYRPNYIVIVTSEGTVIAETTFTDSHIAGYTCFTDIQGANDDPGQKDLTQMCHNYSGLPTSVATEWSWDDTSWPGANTGDACSLFDSDNNGFADFATCVTVEDGPPATQKAGSPRVFSCNDSRSDRCAGAVLIAGPYSTNCTVSQQANNPFDAGNDTVANCTTFLSEVGGSTAQLLDVCSFPSDNPNSDPSDCIRAAARTGKLEVVKDLVPSSDSGLFNLTIDAPTIVVGDVSDGGTTGERVVSIGNHTVGETAGTGTSLSNYTSGIVCKDLNGTGSTIASSTNSGPLTVSIADNADVICTITNTLNTGSVTVHKLVDADGDGTYEGSNSEANTLGFDWGLDAETPARDMGTTATGVTQGSHTVTEDSVSGYHFVGWFPGNPSSTQYSCTNLPAGASPQTTTADVTVVANQTGEVTFCNARDTGTIKVVKQTNPDGSPVEFTFTGDLTGSISDGEELSLQVPTGSHSSTETVPDGWTLDSITCDDANSSGNTETSTASFNVEADETVTCTFTNTRDTGTITVIKNTLGGDDTFDIDITGESSSSTSLTTVGGTDSYGPVTVNTGVYGVAETYPEGWIPTSQSCLRNGEGAPFDQNSFTVNKGDDIVCTFENTKLGTVIVKKVMVGGTDTFTFTGNISGEISINEGTIVSGGKVPGVQTSTESEKSGWDLTDISCDDGNSTGDINTRTATFNIEAGETVTCTFTNTKLGEISGFKYQDLDGDTNTTEFLVNPVQGLLVQLWQWITDSYQNTGQTDTTDANGFYSFTGLLPGLYQVREVLSSLGASWTNLTSTSVDVTLDAGEIDEQNNFVNTQYGSIRVVKQTIPDGSSENFVFDSDYHNENFTLTDGFSDLSGDLLPGTYSVVELAEEGWDLTSATCDDESDPSSISLQSGEVIVCTFTNTQRGHIIVDKVTNPAGAVQSFNFNASGGSYADFSLTDLAAPNDQALVPGTYSVSETEPAGWDLTNTTCISSIRDNETASNLELDAGETIRCTFTNTELGNVTVVKYNDHNGNGIKDDGDETLDNWEIHLSDMSQFTGNGDPAVAGQVTFSDLLPDSFTLSETPQTGWDLTNIACEGEEGIDNDNNHPVELAAGQDITCFIGNQGQGTVTVYKDVDTDNDGDVDVVGSTDWLFELNSADHVMGTTVNIAAGSYILDEFQNPGYHFVSLFCDDVDQNGATTTVNVGPGDDVVCTYTNARDTGSLIIHKIIDVDGDIETEDDQTDGENWEFTVEGNGGDTNTSSSQSTDADGLTTFGLLKTGDYNITETPQDGYDLIYANCENYGSLDGYTIYDTEVPTTGRECTFINTPNGSIHGRKWNDINGNGTRFLEEEPYLSGWKIFIDENDNQSWEEGEPFDITDDGAEFGWYSFEHLFPGTYSVCEEVQPGWLQTSSPQCHTVDIPSGENACTGPEAQNSTFGSTCDFGNQEQILGVSIEKSNDKSGGANAGDTVTYTLVVTNNGNQTIYNLDIFDALPGGFSYVSGTTTGDTTADPSIAGNNLTWVDVDNEFTGGETFTIHYQVKISGDVTAGTYKNFATCEGDRFDEEQTILTRLLDQIIEPETVDCNVDDSDVPVGQGTNFGGNLGQVLGISTELPATGSATALLVLAIMALGAGIVTRKYAKN